MYGETQNQSIVRCFLNSTYQQPAQRAQKHQKPAVSSKLGSNCSPQQSTFNPQDFQDGPTLSDVESSAQLKNQGCCRAENRPSIATKKQVVVCDQGFAAIYGQSAPANRQSTVARSSDCQKQQQNVFAAADNDYQMVKSAQRCKRGSDCCGEDREDCCDSNKVLDIEVMKCKGCGEELTRKKVSFYFIRIKKQKKEHYDFRTLKCSECNKGFNGKNNYVFFCMNNKCDYLCHPDKDCQVKGRSFFRKEVKPVTAVKPQPISDEPTNDYGYSQTSSMPPPPMNAFSLASLLSAPAFEVKKDFIPNYTNFTPMEQNQPTYALESNYFDQSQVQFTPQVMNPVPIGNMDGFNPMMDKNEQQAISESKETTNDSQDQINQEDRIDPKEEKTNQQIADLENQISLLDEKVRNLTRDLQSQKKESQLQYAVLQSDFAGERIENHQKAEEMQALQTQVRIEQELRANETNYLRADLEQALHVKAILEEKLSELKAELRNQKDQSECLNLASQTQIRELEEQIAQAHCKFSSAKRRAEIEFDQQAEQINQQKMKIEDMGYQIKQQELNHSEQLEIQRQAMSEQVDELRQKHAEQSASAQTLLQKEMNEKELLYREIALLKAQLYQKDIVVEQLGTELKKKAIENEDLQVRVETAEDELTRLQQASIQHNYGSFRESLVESFVSVMVEN